MNNVWDGKHFWIWNLPSCMKGDISAIIRKLKDLGVRGVMIKSDDGGRVWKQFKDAVSAFKDAGFVVGAWGYHYGNNVSAEASATLSAIYAGADWYVINAETEYKGKQKQALELGRLLRTGLRNMNRENFKLGYSSFALADLHSSFPYKEFSSFCDAAIPQIYWGEFTRKLADVIRQTYDVHKKWGIPLMPAGQTYPPSRNPLTPESYKIFEAMIKDHGATGVSFWSLQHADAKMFEAVRAMNFPIKIVSPIESVPDVPPNPVADPTISEWARSSVEKAVKAEILVGSTDGKFHGSNPITREQLAVVLDRLGIIDEELKKKGS